MRLLRSFSIVTFVLLLVLALASCQDSPTGPPSIGTLMVTPVALTPCGNFSAPLGPQGMQMVDCGW